MRMSRRLFFAFLGLGLLVCRTPSALPGEREGQALRVIAYNVYGCSGWPKDRVLAKKAVAQGQMAKRLALELALYEPDIINFSESPGEAITKEVAKLLGMRHIRFPSAGNWPGTLLSKYEIIDSKNVPLGYDRPKELFTRHWGRATIKLPDGKSLIVHSAHLHPAADPSIRLEEIKAMLAAMKGDVEAGHSMLLIGDLNHVPDTEEYKLWVNAGWTDTFAKVGKDKGLTFTADTPEYRIDYIMAAGPITKRLKESRPLFEGAFRLNIADKQSFALSDHLPQFAVYGGKK